LASPIFTYSSDTKLSIGDIVLSPLNGRIRESVIIEETTKPESYIVEEIKEVSNRYFSIEQLESAKFISKYYFSSLGEALALFQPYTKDTPQTDINIDNITPPSLSGIQQKAYEDMNRYSTSLLFGVTGSGKTELFIKKIIQILKDDKSAILLMPEISLTPQMLKRLKSYFGNLVDVWHSKLSRKRKEDILSKLRSGEIRVIAGARSALFLPMQNLGLIIVDEEHDDSYKAMTRPRYHARDLSVWIGKKFDITVWLASATPSLTSYINYPIARLKQPYIQSKKEYHFISGDTITPQILSAIESNYKRGEQSSTS